MMIDDGNDISCVYVYVHVWVCADSGTVVALDTHHHGHHHHHLFSRRLSRSFNVMLVSLTSITNPMNDP